MLGTENKEVLILNPAGSAIVSKLVLPAVPVFMAITGTLDVEYRIAVACRDNNVYTIKVRVILAPPPPPLLLRRLHDILLACHHRMAK